MFSETDFQELDRLRLMGARRVRFANGAEVEFDTFRMLPLTGAQPDEEAAPEETAPLAAMPSRAELRKLAQGLAPPPEKVEVASE